MRQRKWAALFSAIIFIASIVALSINHLNLALDFTGGSQAVVHYKEPIASSAIRRELSAHGFKDAVVQA